MPNGNGHPSFEDVVFFLSTCNLDDAQQRRLVEAWNGNIRSRRVHKKQQAAARLFAGQKVSFGLRRGGTMTGTIQKVGRSNCWVIGTDNLRYYAPATGLTVIS